MNKLIGILLLFLLIMIVVPSFSWAQETKIIKTPENTDEVRTFLNDIWEKIKNILPGEIDKIWKEEVLPMWNKMRNIWSKWWDASGQPWLKTIWDKIMSLLGKEVEKRKPYVEEEFQKEKKELIEEADQRVPEKERSLWERFKELIQ